MIKVAQLLKQVFEYTIEVLKLTSCEGSKLFNAHINAGLF